MTCIVGVVDKAGHIWMGADSAGVAGNELAIRKDLKVFKKGPYLIGSTWSFRMHQIVQYQAVLPDPPDDLVDEDLFSFMVMKIVPAIRESFKEHGFLVKKDEQESGGRFLIGLRGRLFVIEPDFQVAESVDTYDAVGSGSQVAKGALTVTRSFADLMEVEVEIKVAIRAAIKHVTTVDGPIHIITEAKTK